MTRLLHDDLRTWAKGSLPTSAAIDFLIDCNALSGAYVHVESTGTWYDFATLSKDLADGGLGWLSGGERATLVLAVSMYHGELNEAFWRIDPERKAAFIRALTAHS